MNWSDTLQAVRQKAFPRTYALERELAGLRDEHERAITVLDELAQKREHDAQQLAGLQRQLESSDAERKEANEQAQSLETSLAEAMVRQHGAEEHIRSLEKNLDETRSRHEASIELTQDTMLRLQTEQQNLLTLQTGLAKTFHEVGKQLVETMQARASQPRLPMLQMVILSGLLFLSGALVSNLVMRGNDSGAVDVSAIERGIGDLQQLMKAHFKSHDELLKILTQILDNDAALLEKSGDKPTVSQSPSVPGLPEPVQADMVNRTEDPVTGYNDVQLTRQQIDDLQVLGFAPGKAGNRSLAEVRSFYLPVTNAQPEPSREEVESVLVYYADLARADEKKYQLDEQVLAAIRLGSLRTRVDFSFLMELADVESDFDPLARSPTSDAAGLYQFRANTWLDAVRAYGDKYGLGRYATRIEYTVDSKGVMQPMIKDAAVHDTVLGLRFDPRLSALLAAEHVRKNIQRLSSSLERQPGRTELYLTHFFGTTGAISFLKALADEPGKVAGEIFPGPARRNRLIFQNKARKPRTVAEVYNLFDRKFNTSRYEGDESG
jgi:hypothetical protein